MKKYITVLIILLNYTSIAQGAWTQKRDKKYIQLSFSTINKYHEVFGNPDYITEREVTDNTLQLYGEYGLTNKTTLIANIPVKLIETAGLVNNTISTTTAQSISNLGNIEIGVRQQLYNKKWIISTQLNIETNTSSYYKTSGIRTGTNAWSFTPTINIGKSFKSFYTQGFTGLNIKTNGYSSNFKIGGEIGVNLFKPVLFIAFIDIVKSFENGNINLPTSNILTSLYINNQEYGGYGFKGIGKITENFGINAAVGGAFFGKNVAKKAAITFGVYQKI